MGFSYLLSRVVIFTCLLVLTLTSISFGQKFGKISDEEWGVGPPEAFPEANAVILFKNGKMNVTKDNIVLEFHIRIKLLTQSGIDDLGDLSIDYDKDDKLKDFKAQTFTPDGKKHKVKKDAIFDKESGAERERVFAFPALTPGCIIEYKYKLRSKNFRFLEPWFFQESIFVMKSVFSVALFPGFTYDVTYFNFPYDKRTAQLKEVPDPTRTMGTGMISVFTWELENLLPIKDEPYMSALRDYMTGLAFRIISFSYPDGSVLYFSTTWGERGDDMRKYTIENYCNKTGDVKKLAATITAGLATPREKSRAIYKYVAREFKTSNTPRRFFTNKKMSELFKSGAGSAEEKNILIAELHKAVDIPAWVVMISTRYRGRFDPENVNTSQFNHMITFAEFTDGWEFLDASSKYMPYGILPSFCLTNGGLLIDGKNSSPVTMTIKPFESKRLEFTKMYIDSDYQITCSTTTRFSGYSASYYGKKYDEMAHDDFIDDYFIDNLNIECTKGKSVCELDSNEIFVAKVNFTTGDLTRLLDDNLMITPVKYGIRENPFKSKKRFFPVDFAYAFTYYTETEIFVADSVAEFIPPENIDEQMKGVSFGRESEVTDSSIIVRTQLDIKKPVFGPQVYNKLRKLFDKIALSSEDQAAAVIVKELTEE